MVNYFSNLQYWYENVSTLGLLIIYKIGSNTREETKEEETKGCKA
jgi:hypothetical protein